MLHVERWLVDRRAIVDVMCVKTMRIAEDASTKSVLLCGWSKRKPRVSSKEKTQQVAGGVGGELRMSGGRREEGVIWKPLLLNFSKLPVVAFSVWKAHRLPNAGTRR